MRNISDVAFPIQHCLIQVSDAPALGNVELEEISQLFRCLRGDRISPGPEGDKLVIITIEHKVPDHHSADTDRAHFIQRDTVTIHDGLRQRGETFS